MKIDAKNLLIEVRANTAALENCPLHFFDVNAERKFGEKYICCNCGGKLNAGGVSQYLAGYEAAGGDVEKVFPGYRKPVKETP